MPEPRGRATARAAAPLSIAFATLGSLYCGNIQSLAVEFTHNGREPCDMAAGTSKTGYHVCPDRICDGNHDYRYRARILGSQRSRRSAREDDIGLRPYNISGKLCESVRAALR